MWLPGLGCLALCGLTRRDVTFSTGVKVVNVLAAVRDHDGRIIQDLTKDDFEVREDGRPQTIKYFSQESDLPLKIGLLVDTSRSQILRAGPGAEGQLYVSWIRCCERIATGFLFCTSMFGWICCKALRHRARNFPRRWINWRSPNGGRRCSTTRFTRRPRN